jgi:hypothetical protein
MTAVLPAVKGVGGELEQLGRGGQIQIAIAWLGVPEVGG